MKILLVDDEECLRETLREIIPANADFSVEIETSADGHEALRPRSSEQVSFRITSRHSDYCLSKQTA